MSLPGWLTPLPDAAQMRAADAAAIAGGTPGPELMERAGTALADEVARLAPSGRIVVLCGAGNNGGDGYVCARVLRLGGREVDVVALVDPDQLRGDARWAEGAMGTPGPLRWDPKLLDGAALVVDCMLGTGATGAPRDTIGEAIAELGARPNLSVVACDVPSGIDASSGEVAAGAVRATTTVTFAAAKLGLWIAPAKRLVRDVRVVDIGLGDHVDATSGLLGSAVLAVLEPRDDRSTKFSSGHVVVAGGARGLTGAPCLSAQAAMRAGAGYVTAVVCASLEAIFEVKLTEVMTRGVTDVDGHHAPAGVESALETLREGSALVLGPGLGRTDGAHAFARELAARTTAPLVLDADGLGAHASDPGELASRGAVTVLTPHAGELGRLLGVSSDEVQTRRLHHARELSRRAGAVVVLKGDDTLVVAPDGRVAVSPGGAPGLATAGTGDLLAGVCGALLAQGHDPFTAACAAVWVHLAAGRIAAREHGPRGVIASDVLAALPAALAG